MKSVSLILLLFFFLVVQKQWALLNNAWRMMNYGQEWQIKKNGPLPVYMYIPNVDRYLTKYLLHDQASMLVY